jgi:hypothetical protein
MRQEELYFQAMEGCFPHQPFADAKRGELSLQDVLQGKKCVIVLDDVHEHRQVRPFRFPGCLTVVTTRKLDWPAMPDTHVIHMDVADSVLIQARPLIVPL